jgi:dimethylhistidine N-methyltransferase
MTNVKEMEKSFYKDVLTGLRSVPKRLEPKYLYDYRGSELFEEITKTLEYYPTRTEMRILKKELNSISHYIGDDVALIEFGSGSSEKIKFLLHHLKGIKEYVAIDISESFLLQSVEKLKKEHRHLYVHTVCADYTVPFSLPSLKAKKKVLFFPGSTIGNFDKQERKTFLNQMSTLLTKGDGFIIGVDLKKDEKLLHSAYNDAKQVTRAFNLNLLQRMNRELLANFIVENFEHKAFYNHEEGRVEMHIESLKDQLVTIGEEEVSFQKGETIHTESSYKFSVQEFQNLAKEANFIPKKVWTDEENLFSVHYLEVKA